MLDNRKRLYMLPTFTVEKKQTGWFFKKAYTNDEWHGPYVSESSVSLMIARSLKRELLRRDRAADPLVIRPT